MNRPCVALLKRRAPRGLERQRRLVPGVALDGNPRPVEPQDVERVHLAAPARRQGAGLDDERRVPRNLVSLGAVADVAHVQVAGEKDVGAGGRQLLHRHVGAADQMLVAVPLRQIERMVRDDDADCVRRRGAQARRRARDL